MPVICICVNCEAPMGGIRSGEPDKVKCPLWCSKSCEKEYAEKHPTGKYANKPSKDEEKSVQLGD